MMTNESMAKRIMRMADRYVDYVAVKFKHDQEWCRKGHFFMKNLIFSPEFKGLLQDCLDEKAVDVAREIADGAKKEVEKSSFAKTKEQTDEKQVKAPKAEAQKDVAKTRLVWVVEDAKNGVFATEQEAKEAARKMRYTPETPQAALSFQDYKAWRREAVRQVEVTA